MKSKLKAAVNRWTATRGESGHNAGRGFMTVTFIYMDPSHLLLPAGVSLAYALKHVGPWPSKADSMALTAGRGSQLGDQLLCSSGGLGASANVPLPPALPQLFVCLS